MPLSNQVAVVTGAAQGLGRAIAETLAARGAAVIIADLQREKAEAVAAALASGGRDRRRRPALGRDVDRRGGRAVRGGRRDTRAAGHPREQRRAGGRNVAPIVELRDEEWEQVLKVKPGRHVSSVAARRRGSWNDRSPVASSTWRRSTARIRPRPVRRLQTWQKAGVISLTRSLALELAAYGVRVQRHLSPVPVYTDFNRKVMAQRSETLGISEEEMIERIRQAIPLGRWGEPEDIAFGVASLCDSETRPGWTGEILRISGGNGGRPRPRCPGGPTNAGPASRRNSALAPMSIIPMSAPRTAATALPSRPGAAASSASASQPGAGVEARHRARLPSTPLHGVPPPPGGPSSPRCPSAPDRSHRPPAPPTTGRRCVRSRRSPLPPPRSRSGPPKKHVPRRRGRTYSGPLSRP